MGSVVGEVKVEGGSYRRSWGYKGGKRRMGVDDSLPASII